MTVLIAGGSGLVGRCLAALLEERKIPFLSTYNSRPTRNGHKVNFDRYEEIETFFETHKPTVCVNCIVQRLTDVCEKDWDETKRVNIDIVDRLAKVCKKFGVYLIHISTDYVFDGKAQPNLPSSETNPLQNYGISKLISEKRVIANSVHYAIVRVPVLYCDNIENLEENAVTLIGKKVLNQIHKTSEDDYSIRRPVYIPDFCKYILNLINNPVHGLFHFYNPYDRYTKYEIAKMIAGFLGKSHAHITPSNAVNSNVANRPYDTELRDTQYTMDTYCFTPLQEGIQRCFKRFKHPSPLDAECAKDCFLLLDLDGTLLDTDKVHYEAYKIALKKYNINLSYSEFNVAINTSSVESLVQTLGVSETELEALKKSKYEAMLGLGESVKLLAGAEEFLETCLKNRVNMAIVTNTSQKIVEFYKEVVPVLKRVPNWICREEYTLAKPNEECYKLATRLFYKGETYRIGFENTLNGLSAIRSSVDCVYFITDKTNTNYSAVTKEDVYILDDFYHFIDREMPDRGHKRS